MLTAHHKQLIQSSFQQVLPISDTFVRTFYDKLFELAPDTKHLFVNSLEEQGSKLMAMLVTAIKGLDRFEELLPALRGLGQRHVAYGVKCEHYTVTGKALLLTLEKLMGDNFTDEVRAAWTALYDALTHAILDGVVEPRHS